MSVIGLRLKRSLCALPVLFIGMGPMLEAAESVAKLKGIVEKVEAGRFVVDSAWVVPRKSTSFVGKARNVGRIKAGYWAEVSGSWGEGGILRADRIETNEDYPGHTFQNTLTSQGLSEAEKIGKSGKTYNNPEVVAYVRNIGASVVPEWARSEFKFQFGVISDPTLNAFALPDGSIFVHTGLLARIENDSQLAAILGHEVAHVTQRHGARGYKKQMTTFLPAMIGAQVVGSIATKDQSAFVKTATAFGLGLTVNAAVNGYGRSQEDQADRVGMRYMVDAGYDPAPAPEVWDIFNQTYGDQSKIENFFYGNHSTNSKRKKNQREEIRRHYSDPAAVAISRPVNAKGYQKVMLPLTRDNAVLDFEAKRYPIARAGFDRVLTNRPDDPVALTYLGRIALAGSEEPGRFSEAEAKYRKAIAAEPKYPDAHRELGKLLASQNKASEAKSELRKYLELAPSDAPDRGEVASQIGKL